MALVIVPENFLTPQMEVKILERQLVTVLDNIFELYGKCPEAVMAIQNTIAAERDYLTQLNAGIEWLKESKRFGLFA